LDIQTIIARLEAKRDRLDSAIAALKGSKPGKATSNGRRGRHLSAAAKKRISIAQKKRWAARKRAGAS
jgi:exonuclease VII small subunit